MDNFLKRIIGSTAAFGDMLKRPTPFIRQKLVAGGAAGEIAVADIKKEDQIVGVMHDTSAGVLADLTAEFVANTLPAYSVVKDGYIDNTGGTATTGDVLLVTWVAWG